MATIGEHTYVDVSRDDELVELAELQKYLQESSDGGGRAKEKLTWSRLQSLKTSEYPLNGSSSWGLDWSSFSSDVIHHLCGDLGDPSSGTHEVYDICNRNCDLSLGPGSNQDCAAIIVSGDKHTEVCSQSRWPTKVVCSSNLVAYVDHTSGSQEQSKPAKSKSFNREQEHNSHMTISNKSTIQAVDDVSSAQLATTESDILNPLTLSAAFQDDYNPSQVLERLSARVKQLQADLCQPSAPAHFHLLSLEEDMEDIPVKHIQTSRNVATSPDVVTCIDRPSGFQEESKTEKYNPFHAEQEHESNMMKKSSCAILAANDISVSQLTPTDSDVLNPADMSAAFQDAYDLPEQLERLFARVDQLREDVCQPSAPTRLRKRKKALCWTIESSPASGKIRLKRNKL